MSKEKSPVKSVKKLPLKGSVQKYDEYAIEQHAKNMNSAKTKIHENFRSHIENDKKRRQYERERSEK
jgi:hypothetical protein